MRSYRTVREYVRTMSAEARVEQHGRGGRVRATVYLLLARDNRLRIDAMTQFGPALTVTFDGLDFAMSDYRNRRFAHSHGCIDLVGQRLGLPLPAQSIVSILVGEQPFYFETKQSAVCSNGEYQVVTKSPQGRRELSWSVRPEDRDATPAEQRLRLTMVRDYDAHDNLVRSVTYEDYRIVKAKVPHFSTQQGIAMPFLIRYREPRARVDTVIRYKEMELNAALPVDAFTQTPRPGLIPQQLQCTKPHATR